MARNLDGFVIVVNQRGRRSEMTPKSVRIAKSGMATFSPDVADQLGEYVQVQINSAQRVIALAPVTEKGGEGVYKARDPKGKSSLNLEPVLKIISYGVEDGPFVFDVDTDDTPFLIRLPKQPKKKAE